MPEDLFSPQNPGLTISERLSQTGSKISELSKKAAASTKQAVGKVADAGKDAVSKTNKAVSQRAEAKREKKEEKLTQKIEDTKAELKDDGFIDLAPAMITLPEFEEERMALMGEEHDILVDLVDHMHALSQRVDQLEQTYHTLALEEKSNIASHERNASSTRPAVFNMLFVSLVWVALLIGFERVFSQNNVLIVSTYPAEIFSWAIGTGVWVVYMLNKIGKAAPIFKLTNSTLGQVGLFTGVVSLFLLLLSDDKIATISTVYITGLVIALAVLFTSRMITDEVEIIG